jgi:hypothetical protein
VPPLKLRPDSGGTSFDLSIKRSLAKTLVASRKSQIINLIKIIVIMANKFILTLLFCMCFWQSKAQESDTGRIEQTCMNYFEGFYDGDSTKIKSSIKPSLYKYGYWKKTNTEVYMGDGHMTFQQAIDCSNDVLKNKNFAKSNAPKKVNVQDISNHIAAAKITAWWGTDYILLYREGDKWMIEQVLWEGPLEEN